MNRLLLLVLLLSGNPLAASAQNFEAPTYQKDQLVDGVEGWQAEGEASISTAESSGGAQSLRVGPDSVTSRPVAAADITFVDLHLLPVFHDAASPEGDIDLLGARLAFVQQGIVGRLMVEARDGSWTTVGRDIPLAGESTTEEWLRLTARIDPKAKVWDLYLDGLPVRANLPLVASSGFAIHGAAPEVYADNLTATSSNPLFPDHDGDGIPDAEEVAAGQDPFADDRAGDIDGDGIVNIDEFFLATRTSAESGPGARGRILYVDNATGSNSNTGRRSYDLAAGDGPLASIRAAMQAASNNSTIIILPGTGLYDEGSRDARGKALTIKTVAPTTIK